MKMQESAAIRVRRDHRERGAATLESVGMYAVAAILATGVMLTAATASPVVHDKIRQAICILTTLGQGQCESSTAAARDRRPTEPCVVSAEGHTGAVELSFVVTAGQNEQFLVEKLNNGKSRVTRGDGGKVGTGVGAGANISATWNDKQYGGAAKAGASIAAQFTSGEVYYANNEDEVNDLVNGHALDLAKDQIIGDTGRVRQFLNSAQDKLGLGRDLPEPVETFKEVGTTADLKAEATAVASNAQAGVGAQLLLGKREGADGTSTTYYQASVDGQLSAGGWLGTEQAGGPGYGKAGLEGKAEIVYEIERDANSYITSVRSKSVLAGTAQATMRESSDTPAQSYTEEVVELPTTSPGDQAIAQRYLNAMGMGPMGGFKDLPQDSQSYLPIINPLDGAEASKAFAQAAGVRGTSTRQQFDDSGSALYDATVDAEDLLKVGGNISVDRVDRKSIGAEYWDGKTYVPWTGCAKK